MSKFKHTLNKGSRLIIALFFLSALTLPSMLSAQTIGGTTVNYPNGQKDWSDPVDVSVRSKKMKEKNEDGVRLKIRIKLKKKVILACHYEVEITNTSDTKKLSMSVGTGYTDAYGKPVVTRVTLKPGQTKTVKVIYADLSCKIKHEEDCGQCSWEMSFWDVKAK